MTDYVAMNDPELLKACGDRAEKWAAAFCQHARLHNLNVDEGWMITWFANAIENSWQIRSRVSEEASTL